MHPRIGWLRGMAITGATAVSLAAGVAVAAAADTPSLGNGDCWQASTPLTCAWNHVGVKGYVWFRAIDQFSGTKPAYLSPAQAAVNAWNSAPGPQFVSFTPAQNDVWTYMKVDTEGQNGSGGHTVICDYITKSCSSAHQPYDIWYSTAYINTSYGDVYTAAQRQNDWGHEFGHSMGLDHNTTDSGAIMWPQLYATVGGPNSSDIGHWPGCTSGGHGMDCIYGLGD